MNARPKRALIVADWERLSRAVHWEDDLRELQPHIISEAKVIRLADSPASLLRELVNWDILILNFDSINGDPIFGSDAALAWFRHRDPELLGWVAKGGILIVEGQTMLSVPTQESYDALFGQAELRVSGPSVKPVPGLEEDKTGGHCKITNKAKRYNLFPGATKITCTEGLRVDHFFPYPANLALSTTNEVSNWSLLYRGWFSRLPAISGRFRWVTLVETDDRQINQRVLVGAGYGKGATFVSTMLLAGTGQTRNLIRSLVQWNPDDNPLPKPWWQPQKALRWAAAPLFSAVASVITTEVLKLTGVRRVGSQWLWAGGLTVALTLVISITRWIWRAVSELLGL